MRRPGLILALVPVVMCFAATLVVRGEAGERTEGILAEGTPFESRWYAYDSGVPGPTVIVTGGMHGNEPAGARAARQIADWTVRRGRLVVLPRCNEPALTAGTRRIPELEDDEGDLNRHFPRRDAADSLASEQGVRIWKFVKEQEPDVLLDLHEGYGIRASGSESVGSSVLSARQQDNDHQLVMLESVNVEIQDPKRQFSEIDSAVNGSLVRAAIEQLGIEAHILETTHREQPLSTRCRQHRRMVAALLTALEMNEHGSVRMVRPTESRPAVALYDGPGAGTDAQGHTFEQVLGACRVERIGPSDVHDGALAQFDVVLFPGGSGSKQGKALAGRGRDQVRQFIENGGGYVGVCAGAYLALHNYDWSLKLLPLDSFDREHWRRGNGTVVIESTRSGESILHLDEEEAFDIHFGQGPLMVPTADSDLPAPRILSYYRTGIGRNGADPESMVDTPAIVAGEFGGGRVLLFSPHPEKTSGLEDLIERAVLWEMEASVVEPKMTGFGSG